MDFRSYVSRIIWEADNDSLALPLDTYRVYCIEGQGEGASSVGSLSSLGSALADTNADADFSYESLRHWGPKFEGLTELYRRPELPLGTYREAVRSPTPTQGRGQGHGRQEQQL